jgi:adenine-specific DNA-methyltransferase
MEKMTGKSKDLIAENIEQLKALFPEAVTEGKIDFEVLKALLGEEVEKRETYYKFTWNGKEEARAYARIPSMGTLRPCVEESSGKDGTPGKFDSENLYIEGDNLEVLKLLQGPYHKKVKMIYIDPPYNTGKDFVYPDNYRDSIANYKSLTGQTDEKGVATRANPETSGRYHTDWLNMMYPRLILARNLLSDDGAIYISIDDSEFENLCKLCNEVFGEENFVANIIWVKKYGIQNDAHYFSTSHDYIVVFTKNIQEYNQNLLPRTTEQDNRYKNPDNDPRGPWKAVDFTVPHHSENRVYDITLPSGRHVKPATGRSWAASEEDFPLLVKDNRIWFGIDGDSIPSLKRFLSDVKDGVTSTTVWNYDEVGHTDKAKRDLAKLMDGNIVFDYPKPVELIKKTMILSTNKNAIILDFFSGSATSAHATMQINAEDGGQRRFIMVQLPEVCETGTEVAKAGYKNICDIGKNRIRHSAQKIKEENPLFTGDMGFKVFKLDTSNFIPWNPEPEKIELFMRNTVENILADRSRQDLLYEVLLKCNLPLTLPIDEKKFGENTVYVVGAGVLAICLDTEIPQTIADEIVKLRDEYAPIVPMQVVFRDNGFTDVAKTNALQILKQAGFEEKSIQSI